MALGSSAPEILLATFGWDSLRKARMLAGSDWTDED